MLSIKKDDFYKNPLGEYTEEEFIKIKQEGKIDDLQRNFRITECKCPPKKYKPTGILCFYCFECFDLSFKKVKIRKGK